MTCINLFSAINHYQIIIYILYINVYFLVGAQGPSVDCKDTKFGCCWDNSTSANGNSQEGCPCKNHCIISDYYCGNKISGVVGNVGNY